MKKHAIGMLRYTDLFNLKDPSASRRQEPVKQDFSSTEKEKGKRHSMWQGVEQLRAEDSLEILKKEWRDRMGKESEKEVKGHLLREQRDLYVKNTREPI